MARALWNSTDTDKAMAMAAAGCTDEAIAAEVGRSARSVKDKLYRQRLKRDRLVRRLKMPQGIIYHYRHGPRRDRYFDSPRLFLTKVAMFKLEEQAKRHAGGSVRDMVYLVIDRFVRKPSLIDAILNQQEAAE